jgi:rhodanese-related sulfurtransferase
MPLGRSVSVADRSYEKAQRWKKMSRKHTQKKTATQTKKAKQKNNLNVWTWVGIGMIVVVAVALVYLLLPRQSAGAVPAEISVQDAYAKREAGAYILDVRQPEEWDQVHIPGATLIPLGELASRVNEVPRDQEVVVVCRSGNRSQEGRDILKQAGFENVTSMQGGVNQWQVAGYPTVSGP